MDSTIILLGYHQFKQKSTSKFDGKNSWLILSSKDLDGHFLQFFEYSWSENLSLIFKICVFFQYFIILEWYNIPFFLWPDVTFDLVSNPYAHSFHLKLFWKINSICLLKVGDFSKTLWPLQNIWTLTLD